MKIFDISQSFVFAQDRQRFGGKAVKKGDPVPAGFSRQKLEQFYNTGIIKLKPVEAQSQLPTDPPPVPTAATLDHTGAGWFNIVVDGLGAVNADKLKGREAAEKWAAENNYNLAVDGE